MNEPRPGNDSQRVRRASKRSSRSVGERATTTPSRATTTAHRGTHRGLLNRREERQAIKYTRYQGYTAAEIRIVQQALGVPDDGRYGGTTADRVAQWQRKYQEEYDIPPSGKLTPDSYNAILRETRTPEVFRVTGQTTGAMSQPEARPIQSVPTSGGENPPVHIGVDAITRAQRGITNQQRYGGSPSTAGRVALRREAEHALLVDQMRGLIGVQIPVPLAARSRNASLLSYGLEFSPIIGDIIGAYTAATGEDIRGQEVGTTRRILEALAVLIPYAGRLIRYPVKFGRTALKASRQLDVSVQTSERILRQLAGLGENRWIRQNPKVIVEAFEAAETGRELLPRQAEVLEAVIRELEEMQRLFRDTQGAWSGASRRIVAPNFRIVGASAKQIQNLDRFLGKSIAASKFKYLFDSVVSHLNARAPARSRDLKLLSDKKNAALRLIERGERNSAYDLITSSEVREASRRLYNYVRNRFWNVVRKNDQLRHWFWTEMRVEVPRSGGVPYVRREVVDSTGQVNIVREKITLEHLTRRADNPFRAIDPRNLLFSLSTENLRTLEQIRRLQRRGGSTFGDDKIEQFMLQEKAVRRNKR